MVQSRLTPSLAVVFHDLPGRPTVSVVSNRRESSPTKHHRLSNITLAPTVVASSLRGEQFLPRTTSPTRMHLRTPLPSMSSGINDAEHCNAVWVPSYRCSRFKEELVAAACAQLLLKGSSASAFYTDAQQRDQRNQQHGSEDNAMTEGCSLWFPTLGVRHIIVHINHRTPSDGETVADAARHVECALPGSPMSFRVYSSEARIHVRFLWLPSSDDGAVVAPSSSTLLDNVPGTTLLSELRSALMACRARSGYRPLDEVGWSVAMAVPCLSTPTSDHVGHQSVSVFDTFIVTGALEHAWDVNALRHCASRW